MTAEEARALAEEIGATAGWRVGLPYRVEHKGQVRYELCAQTHIEGRWHAWRIFSRRAWALALNYQGKLTDKAIKHLRVESILSW